MPILSSIGNSLGSVVVNIKANAAQFEKTLTGVEGQLKTFDDKAAKFEKTRQAAQGVGVALMGVSTVATAMTGIAVREFATFEQSMRNVASVSGATEADFKKLSDAARDMGSKTVFSAKEAADGFYYLASAGLKVDDQIGAANGTLKLAAATNSGLAQSAEVVVGALSAFNLEAGQSGHIADIFAKSISTSQAQLGKLQQSLPYTASTFNNLGYSVESNVAALSLLYDKTLKAEMAGTQLRMAVKTLLEPTKDVTIGLGKLGLTIDDVSPATHNLVEIVGAFEKAGLDAATAVKIFGKENEAMLMLANTGSEKLREMEEALRNSGGAAEEMATKQLDSLIGSLRLFKSALSEAAIGAEGGFAQSLRGAVDGITKLIGGFNALPEPIKQVTGYGVAFTAALTGIAGAGLILISQLPRITAGFRILAPALSGVKISMTAIPPAAVAAGAALAALSATVWAAHRIYAATEKPLDQFAMTLNVIKKQNEELVPLIGHMKTQMAALQKDGIDPAAASIADMNIHLETYQMDMIRTLDPTRNAQAVLDVLQRTVSDNKREMQGFNPVLERHTENMKKEEAAHKAFRSVLDKLFHPMQSIGKLLEEQAVSAETLTTKWDDLGKELTEYTAITSTHYKAGLLELRDFWRNKAETEKEGSKASIAIANTLSDLEEELNTERKAGFLDITVAKNAASIARDDINKEFDAKDQKWNEIQGERDRKVATDRLTLESNQGGQLTLIYKGIADGRTAISEGNYETIEAGTKAYQKNAVIKEREFGQELIAVDSAMIAAKAINELAADAEKERRRKNAYAKVRQQILEFYAFEMDNAGAQKLLLLQQYEELRREFEKHGGDLIQLAKWKNTELALLDRQHLEDSLRRFDDYADKITDITDAIFSDNLDGVDKVTSALDSLADSWDDLADGISQSSSTIGDAMKSISTEVSILGSILNAFETSYGIGKDIAQSSFAEKQPFLAGLAVAPFGLAGQAGFWLNKPEEQIGETKIQASLGGMDTQMKGLAATYNAQLAMLQQYNLSTTKLTDERNVDVMSMLQNHYGAVGTLQQGKQIGLLNMLSEYGISWTDIMAMQAKEQKDLQTQYGDSELADTEKTLEELSKLEQKAAENQQDLEFQTAKDSIELLAKSQQEKLNLYYQSLEDQQKLFMQAESSKLEIIEASGKSMISVQEKVMGNIADSLSSAFDTQLDMFRDYSGTMSGLSAGVFTGSQDVLTAGIASAGDLTSQVAAPSLSIESAFSQEKARSLVRQYEKNIEVAKATLSRKGYVLSDALRGLEGGLRNQLDALEQDSLERTAMIMQFSSDVAIDIEKKKTKSMLVVAQQAYSEQMTMLKAFDVDYSGLYGSRLDKLYEKELDFQDYSLTTLGIIQNAQLSSTALMVEAWDRVADAIGAASGAVRGFNDIDANMPSLTGRTYSASGAGSSPNVVNNINAGVIVADEYTLDRLAETIARKIKQGGYATA